MTPNPSLVFLALIIGLEPHSVIVSIQYISNLTHNFSICKAGATNKE